MTFDKCQLVLPNAKGVEVADPWKFVVKRRLVLPDATPGSESDSMNRVAVHPDISVRMRSSL